MQITGRGLIFPFCSFEVSRLSVRICPMRFWKTGLLFLSGLGLLSVARYSADAATVRDRKKIFQDNKFWVIAHRGFSGLYPENTMLAFEKAAALGVDAIELDVHSSRDGKVIVLHDETLDRTTDFRGRALEYGWEDLRKADAGFHFDPDGSGETPFRGKNIRIPLLEEVFKTFPAMKFIIEIKQVFPPIEEPIYRLIRKYKMEENVVVASGHMEPLLWFRTMNPSIATGMAKDEAREFYGLYRMGLSHFHRPAGDALQIPWRYRSKTIITPGLVRRTRRKGLVLHVWTVNEPADLRRMVEAGVDGIISDFPDRLLQVINV
jgi:glycerophosphoryl diester phosphodiesterase